jgi:hypothetical protein
MRSRVLLLLHPATHLEALYGGGRLSRWGSAVVKGTRRDRRDSLCVQIYRSSSSVGTVTDATERCSCSRTSNAQSLPREQLNAAHAGHQRMDAPSVSPDQRQHSEGFVSASLSIKGSHTMIASDFGPDGRNDADFGPVGITGPRIINIFKVSIFVVVPSDPKRIVQLAWHTGQVVVAGEVQLPASQATGESASAATRQTGCGSAGMRNQATGESISTLASGILGDLVLWRRGNCEVAQWCKHRVCLSRHSAGMAEDNTHSSESGNGQSASDVI